MKSYLITDPSFYNSLEDFKKYLHNIYFYHDIDYAVYRDKESFSLDFAKEFLNISQSFGVKNVLLNSYYKEAKELGFFGVHLTSSQFDKIEEAKSMGLFVVVSTHSFDEINLAKSFGADAVTFSPVFFSPNKGEPKGIEMLKKAVELSKPMKCFALGGIVSKKQIQKCKSVGAFGFASIRYFI